MCGIPRVSIDNSRTNGDKVEPYADQGRHGEMHCVA